MNLQRRMLGNFKNEHRSLIGLFGWLTGSVKQSIYVFCFFAICIENIFDRITEFGDQKCDDVVDVADVGDVSDVAMLEVSYDRPGDLFF